MKISYIYLYFDDCMRATFRLSFKSLNLVRLLKYLFSLLSIEDKKNIDPVKKVLNFNFKLETYFAQIKNVCIFNQGDRIIHASLGEED